LQRFRGSGVWRFRGWEVQGLGGSGVWRFRVLRFRDSEVQGFRGTEVQGSEVQSSEPPLVAECPAGSKKKRMNIEHPIVVFCQLKK